MAEIAVVTTAVVVAAADVAADFSFGRSSRTACDSRAFRGFRIFAANRNSDMDVASKLTNTSSTFVYTKVEKQNYTEVILF